MKIILYLILYVTAISCDSSYSISETKRLLTNDSIKYWDLIVNDGYVLKGKVECLMFSENNDCIVYHYDKRGNKIEYKSHDEVFENKFKVINYKQLNIDGEKNNILYLSKDSLILEKQYNKAITKYISSEH